jgi:hypothetical protein
VRASEPARIVHKIEVIHNVDGGEQMAKGIFSDKLLQQLDSLELAEQGLEIAIFKENGGRSLRIEIRFTCQNCAEEHLVTVHSELP